MDNYKYITKKPSPIEKKSTNKEIKESFITMEGTGEGASLWTGIVSAVCTFLVVILLFANDIQMAGATPNETGNIPTLNKAKFSLIFVIFAAGIYCLQYSIKKNLSKKVSDQNERVTSFLNNIGITKNEVHLKESISVFSQGTRKPKGTMGWVSAILKFLLEFVTSGSFIAMLIFVFMNNGAHRKVPQISVAFIIVLFVILFATATASYFMLTHQIYDSIDVNKLKEKVKKYLENKVNTNCSSLSENDKTAIRKDIYNMIPIRKTSTINNIILLIITIAIIIYILLHTDFKDEFVTRSSAVTRSIEDNQKIILKYFLLYVFGTIICNIIPLFSISKSMNETQYNQLEAIYRNIETENIDSNCLTEEVEPEAEE